MEINVTPGLTNRLLVPLVDEVWTTYAASAESFGRKAVLTGAPVRASLRGTRDAREFHEAVLAEGPLPLAILGQYA